MRLTDVSRDAVLFVARNMRDADKEEIYATRWNDDPEELAAEISYYGTFGWVAWKGDEPVAVVGAIPVSPGCWAVYMFATNKFIQIRFSLTRHVKRVIIPALLQSGARRVECESLVSHTEAHRWLELLGAKADREPVYDRGRNGETYFRYVWRRKDVDSEIRSDAGQALLR